MERGGNKGATRKDHFNDNKSQHTAQRKGLRHRLHSKLNDQHIQNLNQQDGRNTNKQRNFKGQQGETKNILSCVDESWAIMKWRDETKRKCTPKGNYKRSQRPLSQK